MIDFMPKESEQFPRRKQNDKKTEYFFEDAALDEMKNNNSQDQSESHCRQYFSKQKRIVNISVMTGDDVQVDQQVQGYQHGQQ